MGVDSLIVRWIVGSEQKLYGQDANRLIDVYQDALVTGLLEHAVRPKTAVYPNPARHYLKVHTGEMNMAHGVHLDIFGSIGQLVDSRTVPKESMMDDQTILLELPSSMPPGPYFLRISTRTSVVSIKFMKE
jgi:hypothetical protein